MFVMLWLIVFVKISCCRNNLMIKFMNYDNSHAYSLIVTNRGHLATFDMCSIWYFVTILKKLALYYLFPCSTLMLLDDTFVDQICCICYFKMQRRSIYKYTSSGINKLY